jgi:GNAT superfamily N-acetyltransferase
VSLVIRAAQPADGALILSLVRELADYEKLSAEVEATEEWIAAVLFGDTPRLFCEIAMWNGASVGFSTWFLNYSTFRGSVGIFIEDLFVRPAYRGHGVGKGLMASLARRCIQEGYGRCEWAVLDWNAPAIAFYKSIGAQLRDEWRLCRLSGEALANFARQRAPS